MSFTALISIDAAAIALMMLTLWVVSIPLRDVSIVDVFWGLGFVAFIFEGNFPVEAHAEELIVVIVDEEEVADRLFIK